MTVLTRSDIRIAVGGVLPSADVQTPFDVRFARVSRDYFVEKFSPEFREVLELLRGSKKWAVAYDCDKFARLAVAVAAFAHSKAQGFAVDAPEGCTVGIVCYNVGGKAGQGHCINILITERGVEFYEPQTQKFVTLTAVEKASSWLAQF